MKKQYMRVLSLAGATMLAMTTVLQLPVLESEAAEGPGGYAREYVLVNVDTGEVLADSNTDVTFYAGNFNVLLTAMAACDLNVNMDAPMQYSQAVIDRVNGMDEKITMSPMEQVGEMYVVREMVYSMIMGEVTSSAYQLVETISNGDEEAYRQVVNNKITSLGIASTTYTDVAGMDSAATTTVGDCMTIFMNALGYEVLVGTLQYGDTTFATDGTRPEHSFVNSNNFINESKTLEGALYGMRGTDGAGNTQVMATLVERDGVRLIAVVADSDEAHYDSDTASLIEYGYARVAGSVPEYAYGEESNGWFKVTEPTYLYEKDCAEAVILEKLDSRYSFYVEGQWDDWYQIRLEKKNSDDVIRGYIKGATLEAAEPSKYEKEDETEATTEPATEPAKEEAVEPEVTVAPQKSNLDMAAYSQVLSAQNRAASRKKTMTYIALGAAFISVVGLITLNRKRS